MLLNRSTKYKNRMSKMGNPARVYSKQSTSSVVQFLWIQKGFMALAKELKVENPIDELVSLVHSVMYGVDCVS